MKQFIVDAFTNKVFTGNPAAVCLVESWPRDALMQAIAKENNLSETAFVFLNSDNSVHGLRWFTPGGEIDLCGHATLASAFVVLNYCFPGEETAVFETKSGLLRVEKKGSLYQMEFPSYKLIPLPVTADMTDAFGAEPKEAWLGRDLVCVFDSSDTVRRLSPNLQKLERLSGLLQHATSAGEGAVDCVSRTFAPKLRVPEDPVCGSGHCHIGPLWAEKLGQNRLTAMQASDRGGILYIEVKDGKVFLSGQAALFSQGEIYPSES